MRILGISASRRKWGNSECSTRMILSSAAAHGAETEFHRLDEFDLQHCTGCLRCVYKGRCPLDDDLYALLDLCEGADALVLAAPVYFLCMNSTLVALMDRLLTTDALPVGGGERRAVTVNLLGKREWRGVGRSYLNMTAWLLGFGVGQCLDVVAEGPGDVLMHGVNCERLEKTGAALAAGTELPVARDPGLCPGCMSDFFRIEPPVIVCPVCGYRGDLGAYVERGVFEDAGSKPRIGREWLKWHIDDWLRPSATRYMKRRREVLRRMRDLKNASAHA